MHNGKGWRSKLDVCDLRAFRQHGIKNSHWWTQKHFQKSLSVNTVHRTIHKCKLKLHHAKKKPNVKTIQNRFCLFWTKAHLKWSEVKWKTVLWSNVKWKTVLWSNDSKYEILYGNYGCYILQTKEERDHPVCYQFKSLHLWWYGVALVSMVCAAYTSGKTPSML